MKVFLPFCEEALDDGCGLSGADLVPFEHAYPVLRALRAPGDAPLPAPGEVQVIRPADWPSQPSAARSNSAAA